MIAARSLSCPHPGHQILEARAASPRWIAMTHLVVLVGLTRGRDFVYP